MAIVVWDRFEHDPRSTDAARVRASDHDREVAWEQLGEAFADGRLDRVEYDARSATVASAKLLGDLVPPLEDLAPALNPDSPVWNTTTTPRSVHDQAVERWRRDRREALMTVISVSAICWTIWAVTGADGFLWPLFPMIATAIGLLRTVVQRDDIVERHERKLAAKQARALEGEAADEPDDD